MSNNKENKKLIFNNVHLVGEGHYKKEREENKKEIEKKSKYIKENNYKDTVLREIAERVNRVIESVKEKERNSLYVEIKNARNFIKKYTKEDATEEKKYLEFNYLTENEFDKLNKDEDVKIKVVGHFNPEKKFKDKKKHNVLKIDDYIFDVCKKKKGKTVGYVIVNEEKDKYIVYEKEAEELEDKKVIKVVRYYKKSIYPFLLLLLLFAVLLGSLWINRSKISDITGIDIDDGFDWDGEQTKNNSKQITEQTVIPGFVDLTISKEDPYVQLGNPEKNTVYFVYKLKNIKTGKTIYETKGIAPGKAINWNPYDNLKKGKHDIQIVIETYDVETMRGCNGANQKMTLTLE